MIVRHLSDVNKKVGLLLLLIVGLSGIIRAQVPVPCTNPPFGPGCRCTTAGILCTPDILDGFVFQMSNQSNGGGLPSDDICPGNVAGGLPNNVNWFGFIAWCTSITFNIGISNCSQGGNGGGNSYGVQLGLFGSCGNNQNGWNTISCITNPATVCGGSPFTYPSSQTITANNLVVGQVYYFMMDGCSGSACTITVDVVGTCGTGTIDPWTTGMTGPLVTCVGNTTTYTTQSLPGAREYYYYLDGVQIGTGFQKLTQNVTWTAPGTYTLCVDVSNLPCIPVTDQPSPYCIDIMVCDAANAGTITAAPNPACPNSDMNISVSGYTNNPATHDQYLIITDLSNSILQVTNGATTTFNSPTCGMYRVYSYNVKLGATVPVVGGTFSSSICASTDNCCDIVSTIISFADTQPPTFQNPPQNATFSCYLDVPPIMPLDYMDNCIPPGSVTGTQTGSINNCNGGSLVRTWMVTDLCGNTRTHMQTITVTPVPVATIASLPPAAITVACDAIPTSFPDLTFSNGATGDCAINGTMSPTVTGSATQCGGTITAVWAATDICGRNIGHTQVVTVTPIAVPAFVSPPPLSATIMCNAIPTTVPDLSYTNNGTGGCLISGSVTPTVSGSLTPCGGTLTYLWTYTDVCSRTINATQTLTGTPTPIPSFLNVPANITVSCENAPTSPPDLSYTNGETGICEITGTVSPSVTGAITLCGGSVTYTWSVTDNCGRVRSTSQVVTVNPPPIAAFQNLPPAALTVTCDNIPTSAPPLTYTNGLAGACSINGSVSAVTQNNATACGGNIINTWTFVDPCGRTISYSQTITISPPPLAAWQSPPGPMTVACDAIPTSAPSLDLSNGQSGACSIFATVTPSQIGNPNVCGGTFAFRWQHTDVCGRNYMQDQIITVTAPQPPVFTSSPPDLTVSCIDIPPTPGTISYTNNEGGLCAFTGDVDGVRTGNVTACGGTLTDTWSFTDPCGNTISEQRTIIVSPAPPAYFLDIPSNMTITCQEIPSVAPPLSYTNDGSGSCLIAGSVNPIISANYDECGGTLSYVWLFTDACGRNINASQTFTIIPPPEPMWIDQLPMDYVTFCDEAFVAEPFLAYSNGSHGDCTIEGLAPLQSTTSGGIMYNAWSFTSPCTNITYTHTQEVEIRVSPFLLVDPILFEICIGQSFDLEDLYILDVNSTNPTISFHNADPPSTFNRLNNTVVSPTAYSDYYVYAINDAGCDNTSQVGIDVALPEDAGDDNSITLCKSVGTVNLYSYLSGDAALGGEWVDLNGYGFDLGNPNAFNIAAINAGIYNVFYFTAATSICPPDTARITLQINDRPQFTIKSIDCSGDELSYGVTLVGRNITVTNNVGTLTKLNDSTYVYNNIPIASAISFTVTSIATGCTATRTVNPPNCDCPDLPIPTGTPLYRVCLTDVPVSIVVDNPVAPLQLNWYDTESSDTPIQTNASTLLHTNAAPGLYDYYVATFDPVTMCVSDNRLKIEVEVVTLPIMKDSTFASCDDNYDGSINFDLVELAKLVNSNPVNTRTVHLTAADAAIGTNPLPDNYANSVNPQTLFVAAKSPLGCSNVGQLTISVLSKPTFGIGIMPENCLDDKSGSMSLTSLVAVTPYQVVVNFVDKKDTTMFSNLGAGVYNISVENSEGCKTDTTATINQGIKLTITNYTEICDNRGTLIDAADDLINIRFEVQNNLGSLGNVVVKIDGAVIGTFPYNSPIAISLPADGTAPVLTVEDELVGCEISRTVGPLIACSTDCIIDIDSLLTVCSDNGTALDPSDDIYSISFIATSINGAATELYSVAIDNVQKGIFKYGSVTTVTVPATAQSVVLKLTDTEDLQCQKSITFDDLFPCSDSCLVTIAQQSLICNNNGTVLDETDDYYTLDLVTSGINTGSGRYNLYLNGLLIGEYAYGQEVSRDLPADSARYTLIAIDLSNNECVDSFMTKILINCSTACSVNAIVANTKCDNNGTNNIDIDDTYTFDMTVTGGRASSWMIPTTNISGGYEVLTNYGPFAIDNGNINWTIVDNEVAECSTDVSVEAPATCSACIQKLALSKEGNITCLMPEVTISAVFDSGGKLKWTYDGDLVDSMRNTKATQEGWYIAEVMYADGCYLRDSIYIEGDDNIPVANSGPNQILNCNVRKVTLDGSASSSAPAYVYRWTNEVGTVVGTSLILEVFTPGTYFLQVLDTVNLCASGKDRVVVSEDLTVPAAAIFANPGDIIDCVVGTIILTTSNASNVRYTWITEEAIYTNVDSIIVTSGGLYSLVAIHLQSLCSDTGKIEIIEFEKYPKIVLTAESDLDCDKPQIWITSAGSEDNDRIEITWFDANGLPISSGKDSIIVANEGIYVVQLKDLSNGCTNTDTIEILNLTQEVEVSISPFIEIEKGSSIILNPILSIPESDIASVQWSPALGLSCTDCLRPTVTLLDEQTYTITVIDVFGCIGTAQVRLQPFIKSVLTVPNVIGVGTSGNTTFDIFSNDESVVIDRVLVYDRWGNKIYHGVNQTINSRGQGWDGTFDGSPVVSGVYVYYIDATLGTGKKLKIAGDLSVIH